jgi:drug/metabolite transporter (DMT)-like permease
VQLEIDKGPTAMTTISVDSPSASARQKIGIGLVILSTIAIAIVPSFARLAYDGGSNALTVITARSFFTVLVTATILVFSRRTWRIDRNAFGFCALAGASYAVMLCGFLGAVALIPVNTAIVIFFVHPVLVARVVSSVSGKKVSGPTIAAASTALVGLTLSVGLSVSHLNLTGVVLAILAAITCVGVILGNGMACRSTNGLLVVFYMMLSAVITLTAIFVLFGETRVPATSSGWLGFGGVALCSTVGTLAFFCAVPMIGAVRATMISNVEPLLGIVFAACLLGESISVFQIVGVVMVLVSIVVVT